LSVLVVRFGALGDVVLTTPLYRAIRRTHPTAAITVVTKARWAPVLAHNPSVTRVECLEEGEPLTRLAARLRSTRWDYRLDLHGSVRSRALRVLVGGRWRGWPRDRWRRALLVWTGVDRFRPRIALAERYFVAARDLGLEPDGGPADVFWSDADDARRKALAPRSPYAAIVPGAAHATKRWPANHWVDLARQLRARGLAVVALGAEHERGLVSSEDVTDLCGVGLGVTAALLHGAVVAVAGDTGLLHVATAVGTPVVALFGPTSPAFGYAPYRARARIVERPLPCRPCSVYGGPLCPMRHHRCMIDLAPDEVAHAVETLAS
jgi:lipopolysaccharide heptosyltransferase II